MSCEEEVNLRPHTVHSSASLMCISLTPAVAVLPPFPFRDNGTETKHG